MEIYAKQNVVSCSQSFLLRYEYVFSVCFLRHDSLCNNKYSLNSFSKNRTVYFTVRLYIVAFIVAVHHHYILIRIFILITYLNN